jgi:hypothetical protein
MNEERHFLITSLKIIENEAHAQAISFFVSPF